MIVCLDAGMDDKGRRTGTVTSELAATLRSLSSTLACKDMDVVDVPWIKVSYVIPPLEDD
jgi:hypothetical protein